MPAKIQARIKVTDTCWIWDGAVLVPQGYGMFWGNAEPYAPMRRSGIVAHRLVWLILNGPIPSDHLHHLCGVRLCVRPEHLTPLSIVEHQEVHHLTEHCDNGHAWTPENTYYRKDSGNRQCRTCKAATQRKRYANLSPQERAAELERSSDRRRQRKARSTIDERLHQ